MEEGTNLDEAVAKWGADAVYAQYCAGIKVAVGQYIRSVMEDEVAKACPDKDLDNLAGMNAEEQTQVVQAALEVAQAKLASWAPGTKVPATKGSKVSQVNKLLASAKSEEEQEALLALIQEQIAKRRAETQ